MSINVSPRTKFTVVNNDVQYSEIGSGISHVLAITSKGPFNQPNEIISTQTRFMELYGSEIVPDGSTSNIMRALQTGGKVRVNRVAPRVKDDASPNYGKIIGEQGTLELGKLTASQVVETGNVGTYDNLIYLKADDGITPYIWGFKFITKNYGGDVNSLSDGKFSSTLVLANTVYVLSTFKVDKPTSYSQNTLVEEMNLFNFRAAETFTSADAMMDVNTLSNFFKNSMYDVEVYDFTALGLPTTGTPTKISQNQLLSKLSDLYNNKNMKYSLVDYQGVAFPITGIPLFYMYGEEGYVETSQITEEDFIGAESINSGLFAFDDYDDSYQIIASHIGQHLEWNATALSKFYRALGDYLIERQSAVGWVELPKYKTSSTANEPADNVSEISFLKSLNLQYTQYLAVFAGGWKLVDTNGLSVDADTLGTVMGIESRNAKMPWKSLAGMVNGLVPDATGVVSRNYGSDGQYPKLQTLATNAINVSVVKRLESGISSAMLWHNYTVLNDNSSSRFLSTVRAVLFLKKSIKPIYDSYLEQPNTFSTWRAMYYQVKDILDYMVAGEAIFSYEYQGDQDKTKLSELEINNEADVRQGKYKVIIKLWDVVTLQQIDVEISIEKANRSLLINIK